jgi:hypothetical protein
MFPILQNSKEVQGKESGDYDSLLALVVHTCNASTQEAEAGGF